MQGVSFLSIACTRSRSMGRTPQACVLGCAAPGELRHYSVCLTFLWAVVEASREARPFLDTIDGGTEADWQRSQHARRRRV